MYPFKAALPLALAIGAIAASPAAAEADSAAGHAAPGPAARVSGSDAGPPVFPGLVNSRLVRAQKALDRAVDYADDDQPAKATNALYKVRLQTKLAWRATKYVIDNAPPTAPADDAGGRVAVVADQFTTAGAVLSLQHAVAEAAVGMIDSAHGDLRDSLSRTLFVALNQRDTAVDYIHSIDVTPPVVDDVAHVSGAPVGGGSWGSVMPPVADDIEDEISQIDGALSLSATMGAGIRRVLKDAEFQDVMTQRAVNQYWPPVVGD